MPFVLPSQLLMAALRKNDLIPSVIPEDFIPIVQLDIVFPNKQPLVPGDKLTKEEASQEPKVSFLDVEDIGQDAQSSYTLVLMDPDAPSRTDQKFGPWRHWVQTGIVPTGIQAVADAAGESQGVKAGDSTAVPFADTGKVEAATPYLGPGPGPNTGQHRYLFLLYREPKDGFSITSEDIVGNEFVQRRAWNVTEFVEKKNLTLVGVNFFLIDT
ncbi:PEBP-like protein [Serendipita vermifera]|nr:PEBP-like protein [Serendipita vermifera]